MAHRGVHDLATVRDERALRDLVREVERELALLDEVRDEVHHVAAEHAAGVHRQIAGEVAEGVGDLLVAELIGDRAATTTGLDHLERAAALASGHLTSGDPSPHPWAEAVQRHVATGLDLLQQSAATRDPRTASGLHDQAVETLDKAIESLAEQTTVG